tara:strand:- start:4143 stop:4325 length:183 start_codon:yes stop_codon:yes gene_type:complete
MKSDSLKAFRQEPSKKITIETPYGTIESDSGNHFVDVATILVIILSCVALKYFIVKKIKK